MTGPTKNGRDGREGRLTKIRPMRATSACIALTKLLYEAFSSHSKGDHFRTMNVIWLLFRPLSPVPTKPRHPLASSSTSVLDLLPMGQRPQFLAPWCDVRRRITYPDSCVPIEDW